MADRAIVVRAMVGSAVHVREDDTCRAGIVLDCGAELNTGSPVPCYVLIRVARPTPRDGAAWASLGSADSEGWFHHYNDRQTVDRPGGGSRMLDSWHWPDDHDPDCSRFPRGVESRT
jgi:hypothetical protein